MGVNPPGTVPLMGHWAPVTCRRGSWQAHGLNNGFAGFQSAVTVMFSTQEKNTEHSSTEPKVQFELHAGYILPGASMKQQYSQK